MKKVYFASDFHLGAPNYTESLRREKQVVNWLNEIKPTTQALYLMGDLFDFWFDYKTVVPKGYVRLLAKIADFTDCGIPVYLFTGNHDMWLFGYFENELGVTLIRKPINQTIMGKKFYLAHGDGLGPGDKGYKFIKKVFENKLCQWAFKWLHPDLGIGLANYFSKSSRAATGDSDAQFLGEDKEWLIIHSKNVLQKEHFDYFVYGHRHYPIVFQLENSQYVNLGDWITYFTYAEFDGQKLELKQYQKAKPTAAIHGNG
ncbi:MAG: UDP-2,3-diacylglucosamine diphosphatase [Bacteroidetes bacterium]|nr:UDP-2,3-diacylglucosamine diphosphatase [Bacteroidota bacterium]